jgi:hypothetical protein
LPITDINKKQEINNIIIAKNNGLPTQIIWMLYDTMAYKRQNKGKTQTQRKTCVAFTFHGPLIRKVIDIFQQTELNWAWCSEPPTPYLVHGRIHKKHKTNSKKAEFTNGHAVHAVQLT